MKRLLLYCLVFTVNFANAQSKEIKLFIGGAPNEKIQKLEIIKTKEYLGKSVRYIPNVFDPTIEYFIPKKKKSNAAIIVCPGGGYSNISYDMEGTEVCKWINHIGLTAILLKYRVPRRAGQEKHLAPLQDLQRAIRYVRFNAAEYKIEPTKIGIIGFSAGAHLSVMASTSYMTPSYPATDQIDTVSAKPDFTVLIYPAYLSANDFKLAPEIIVNKELSPTLIVQAGDDKTFINSSLFYYYALIKEQVKVEMHLYTKGGHGFGLRSTDPLCKSWPNRVEEWLKIILK